MHKKLNCWEYIKCGREPGGANVDKLGVCKAPLTTRLHKVNGGINGGRICWIIAGTYGAYKSKFVDCTEAHKISSCLECEFHQKVLEEEGFGFINSVKIKKRKPSARR